MVLSARSSDLEGAHSRLGRHPMAPNWHERVSRYSAAVLPPTSRPIEPLSLMVRRRRPQAATTSSVTWRTSGRCALKACWIFSAALSLVRRTMMRRR
eukprot:8164254-Pyramimonas_sp.AAC.1